MASNTIVTVDVASEYNTPQFTLGEQYVSPDGKTYRFVRAQAAKTIGLCYGIDETWEVSSTALVKTETKPLLGIPAQTSSAPAAGFTYKYFWIQTAGNFARIESSATSADNASCFSTSTAGKFDDGDDSGYRVRGLIFTAAASGAAATTGFSANELVHVPVA